MYLAAYTLSVAAAVGLAAHLLAPGARGRGCGVHCGGMLVVLESENTGMMSKFYKLYKLNANDNEGWFKSISSDFNVHVCACVKVPCTRTCA